MVICINAFLYSLFRMSLKPTPSNLAGTLSAVTKITMATALLHEIAYTKQSNRWYFPDYYYSEPLRYACMTLYDPRRIIIGYKLRIAYMCT